MVTAFLFVGIAQVVRMDLLMLLFMLLAFHFFCKGYMTGRRGLYYLIYVFLSLSVLTKGPLGFFIIIASIIAYLVHNKDSREILRLKLPQGITIVILVTGLWILLTIWESGTEYVESVWTKQLIGRAVKSWIHEQKVYYYLIWLPFAFLPWIAYVPRGFVRMWRRDDRFGRLLVWWVIVSIIILSAISYKIFIYILLLLPAMALMTGRVIKQSIFDKDTRRLVAEHIVTACLLVSVGAAAYLFYLISKNGPPAYLAERFPFLQHQYLNSASSFIPIAILCGAAAVVVIAFGIMRRHAAVVISLVVFMLVFSNLLMTSTVPELDDEMSPRIFCESIKKYTDQGFSPATYWIELGVLNYYAGTNMKRLQTLEQMKDFLVENSRAVIVITENHWKLNRRFLNTVEITDGTHIAGRSPYRTYHLLVQDGDKLAPFVDKMLQLRDEGYALAVYRSENIILRHYLDGQVAYLADPEQLEDFLEKNNRAAVVVSDYRLRHDRQHLKAMKITNRTPFVKKTYYILLHNPPIP